MPLSVRQTSLRSKLKNFAALDRMARTGVDRDVKDFASKLKKTSDRDLVNREQTTRLAYVLSLAEDAFGNKRTAKTFMNRYHPLLGATPLEKIETEWGGREVERLLVNAIHGLPA